MKKSGSTKTSPKISLPAAKGAKKASVVPMKSSSKARTNVPKGEKGVSGPPTGKKK